MAAGRTNFTAEGRRARVVSMPCAEVFDAQDAAWKESVLPAGVRSRLAVEAASADYWRKYVGLDGDVLGLDRFGASAPGEEMFKHYGFTLEHTLEKARALLN